MNKSAIEWTDETLNPTSGCTLISPGCANCYAKTLHDMRHKAWINGWKDAPAQYHVPFEKLQLHPERLEKMPLHGKPRRVFVNSMSDLFHDDVPTTFIKACVDEMERRPHMTFQILTKRPKRMCCFFQHYAAVPYPNIWLGVSVENQKYADERIPWLLQTPAAVRFLSCEPLLGPLQLGSALLLNGELKRRGETRTPNGWLGGIDWVIVGGESAGARPMPGWVVVGWESVAGARPMHPAWARALRDQCQAAGVRFFFKQWGEWLETGSRDWYRGKDNVEFVKKHGRTGRQFPNARGISCDLDCVPILIDLPDNDERKKQNGGKCFRGPGHDAHDKRYKEWEKWSKDQSRSESANPMRNYTWLYCVGANAAGRQLDGREWNEFPAEASVI